MDFKEQHYRYHLQNYVINYGINYVILLCSPAYEKEEIAIKDATISNMEEEVKKLIDNYDLDGDEVEEL